MQLKETLQQLYVLLSEDNILTRLLHYVPTNASDDPLDDSKISVVDMNYKEKQKILDQVLLPSDKRYDLDYERIRISRLCFYTGIRRPLGFTEFTKGRHDNPYVSEQTYIFDIYVHVDIDTIDQRLTAIADRLNELLLLKRVRDIGEFRMDFISPIASTPDGFIGLKVAFICVSAQESKVKNG